MLNNMSDDELPSLDVLKEKIDAQSSDPELSPSAKQKASRSRTTALAMRMGVDLVSAIGVSIILGVWLDDHFNSTPLFFFLFFCLGCIAGFRMMMQTNQRAQDEMASYNIISNTKKNHPQTND